jgi:hypothetical protein
MSRDEGTSSAETNWSITQEYVLEKNDVEMWKKLKFFCERDF